MSEKENKKTTAQAVADAVIRQIESGNVLPWRRPWASIPACNPISGTVYSGVNARILPPTQYATFNQLNQCGIRVKEGSKAWPVVYAGSFNPKDEKGEPKKDDEGKAIFCITWKRFSVFSRDCWDMSGADEKTLRILHLTEKQLTQQKPGPEMAEKIIAIPHEKGIGEPCYVPAIDQIRMPEREKFEKLDYFFRVYFHELGHWTGHSKRLARLKGSEFGSVPYAKEELIAELCASTLAQITGVDSHDLPDMTPAYIKNWASVIGKDPNIILQASGPAQKAAEFIMDRAGIKHGKTEAEKIA